MLISAVRKHGIKIYVSDNQSDDETAPVVRNLMGQYELLHYSKTSRLLTADEHFEWVLNLPDTEYRWLFGDRYKIISEAGLGHLVSAVEEDFDVVVVNGEARVHDVPTQSFNEENAVLEQLGWHMTMLTALIYRSSAIAKMNFTRYRGTHFLQTLSIFEFLSTTNFTLRWLSDPLIGSVRFDVRNGWLQQAIQVFVRGWFLGVMSLPAKYSYQAKVRALMSHDANTAVFGLKGVLKIRALGGVTFGLLRSHARELSYTVARMRIVYLWISLLLPVSAVRLAVRVYRRWHSHMAQESSDGG